MVCFLKLDKQISYYILWCKVAHPGQYSCKSRYWIEYNIWDSLHSLCISVQIFIQFFSLFSYSWCLPDVNYGGTLKFVERSLTLRSSNIEEREKLVLATVDNIITTVNNIPAIECFVILCRSSKSDGCHLLSNTLWHVSQQEEEVQ